MIERKQEPPPTGLAEQVKQMEAIIKAQREELEALKATPERKTARLNLLFKPSLLERARAAAKEKGHRSLNEYMEALVERDLKEA